MNDLISRQAAIDAIEKIYLSQTKGKTVTEEINRVAWRCALNCAEEMVRHLPPAQQWIPVRERLPDNVEFPAKYIGILVSMEPENEVE